MEKIKLNIAIIVGAILAILVVTYTLVITYQLNLSYSDSVSTAALGFAIIAFLVMWITLCFTSVQLTKALAKPKLELSFNETGKTECDVKIKRGEINVELWIVNKGNAITDFFQVDIVVPIEVLGGLKTNIVGLVQGHIMEHNVVSSLVNKHHFVCFINRPITIPYLNLKVLPGQEYKDRYELPYKIYGDWGEPQQGYLKINVKKSEVV